MTILGKILVFIVLILALIWNALVVNAYVTRANWKNELDTAKKSLMQAGDAANAERRRSDESRAAADAVIAQLKDEIAKQTASVKTLEDNLKDAQAKLATVQKTEEATQTRDTQEKANAQKTQKQVDILQKELDASEKSKNEAIIAAQVAKNNELQSKIERDSAIKRADELEATVIKLNDPNRGRGGIGSIKPVVDKDFKATVASRDGDLVVINLGANAKLQKGSVVQISRTKPEPKFVGNLTITGVEPFYATGRWTPPAGASKPTNEDKPQAGDTVSVIGN